MNSHHELIPGGKPGFVLFLGISHKKLHEFKERRIPKILRPSVDYFSCTLVLLFCYGYAIRNRYVLAGVVLASSTPFSTAAIGDGNRVLSRRYAGSHNQEALNVHPERGTAWDGFNTYPSTSGSTAAG